jgi:hypothetical protein
MLSQYDSVGQQRKQPVSHCRAAPRHGQLLLLLQQFIIISSRPHCQTTLSPVFFATVSVQFRLQSSDATVKLTTVTDADTTAANHTAVRQFIVVTSARTMIIADARGPSTSDFVVRLADLVDNPDVVVVRQNVNGTADTGRC